MDEIDVNQDYEEIQAEIVELWELLPRDRRLHVVRVLRQLLKDEKPAETKPIVLDPQSSPYILN